MCHDPSRLTSVYKFGILKGIERFSTLSEQGKKILKNFSIQSQVSYSPSYRSIGACFILRLYILQAY